HRTDYERGKDADGHVALRPLGFLRMRGDGVEADVGEEHGRRRDHDAGQTIRQEGATNLVVCRLDPAIQTKDADHAPLIFQARQLVDFTVYLFHDEFVNLRPVFQQLLAADGAEVLVGKKARQVGTVGQHGRAWQGPYFAFHCLGHNHGDLGVLFLTYLYLVELFQEGRATEETVVSFAHQFSRFRVAL